MAVDRAVQLIGPVLGERDPQRGAGAGLDVPRLPSPFPSISSAGDMAVWGVKTRLTGCKSVIFRDVFGHPTEEDQPEDRIAVLRSRQRRVGAQLIRCGPELAFEVGQIIHGLQRLVRNGSGSNSPLRRLGFGALAFQMRSITV